jgi:hypothetical protein
MKAMNEVGEGFFYVRQNYSRISEAKIKEGIFVNPKKKQIFQDPRLHT